MLYVFILLALLLVVFFVSLIMPCIPRLKQIKFALNLKEGLSLEADFFEERLRT